MTVNPSLVLERLRCVLCEVENQSVKAIIRLNDLDQDLSDTLRLSPDRSEGVEHARSSVRNDNFYRETQVITRLALDFARTNHWALGAEVLRDGLSSLENWRQSL